MGVCGEEKTERNTNITSTGNQNDQNEIKPIEENDKLKSKHNPIIRNYTIKLININNNQETEITIEGNLTLKQILSNFKLRENADFIIEFDNNETIKNENMLQKFENILSEKFDRDIPEIINMKYSYRGLDIAENSIQAYIDNNIMIGNAIMDNSETFGIITFDNHNKTLNSYHYQRSEYPELIYLNSFTAYCNAKNCLYFSGGEEEQSYETEKNSLRYDEFFCIDLTQLDKDKLVINQLNKLNNARTWHSMIFVPNKYIFIVGGYDTKSVELYDIDLKKLTKDSELNEIRCECTLCLVNNMYLYAFCGFILNNDFNNTIERCNLLKEKRTWENVSPKIEKSIKFIPSFFAISYFKDDELLLIGGNDSGKDERFDYIYIIGKEEDEKDQIKEYKFEQKENINNIFKDKLFIPTIHNKATNIPLIVGGEIKVIILDTQNGEVSSYDCDK